MCMKLPPKDLNPDPYPPTPHKHNSIEHKFSGLEFNCHES